MMNDAIRHDNVEDLVGEWKCQVASLNETGIGCSSARERYTCMAEIERCNIQIHLREVHCAASRPTAYFTDFRSCRCIVANELAEWRRLHLRDACFILRREEIERIGIIVCRRALLQAFPIHVRGLCLRQQLPARRQYRQQPYPMRSRARVADS